MIYRTFFCLNRNCRFQFTVTDTNNPSCPRCKGRKTQWIPMTTGVISAKTQNADRAVAELRQTYGEKNYNSPRRGERMAPSLQKTPVNGKTMKFAPSQSPAWGVDMPLNRDGHLYDASYCAPTGVKVRTQPVGIDQKANRVPVDKRSATSTGAVPKYEARTIGRI